MTVIRPNSISGVTSITALANEINVFKHDGVLAGLQLNGVNHHTSSGVSTFHTLNVLGNVSVGGTLTYQDVTNIDSVGVITARSGINISSGSLTIPDSIIHSGDTNTKIRFPEADAVTIETNGSERLRINSSGSWGIGSNFGTSGQVLTSQGNSSAPTWATPSSPITRSTNAGPLSGTGNYDFTLPANCFKVEFVGHNIETSGSGTPAFRLGTSAGILASGHYNFTMSGTGNAYRSSRDQIDPFDTNLNAGSDTGEIFMTFSSSSASNFWIFHGMANRRTQTGNMFVMGVPDLGGNALTTIRFFPFGTGFDKGRFSFTAYTTS